MYPCPSCQFRNLDTREKCLKCGAPLKHEAKLTRPSIASRIEIPGGNLFRRAQRFSSRLMGAMGRAIAVPLPTDLPHRFPALAGMLGLVPGLGQIYNHQPKKVLYLIPAWILFIWLSVRFITTAWFGNLFIACTIGVSMISFTDALLAAARVNGQYFTFRNTLAALTYPLFMFGVIVFTLGIMTWMNFPVISLYWVGGSFLQPNIQKGDRICGEGVSYWFRDPEPGDVVRCDPPGYKVEQGTNVYVVNPNNVWERVMAVEGETVESRRDVLYVDGRRLSKAYYPLVWPSRTFRDFKITCPPDKYVILATYMPEEHWASFLGAASLAPSFSGAIPIGWQDACCIAKRYEEGKIMHRGIRDRAWFIYHPATRRRFFQAEGPRFEEDRP
ncbi:hypothetical protein HQ520_17275 [bacterium]|nr:hypothetical protein [bacterium]